MLISGLNKTTLLDYPERVAATVFTGGCNFRCPFCHNAGLVLSPLSQEMFSEEEILSFLKKRKGILSGVCITGGEPTIQQDLPEFLAKIKELGYAIKLDTNGSHPKLLQKLLDTHQIDYVAMDIKNIPSEYPDTAGCSEMDILSVKKSVELLKRSSISYEFRTTVVKELHTLEKLQEICRWIEGSPKYFLQQFEDSGELLAEKTTSGICYHGYQDEELRNFVQQLNADSHMKNKVFLRGVDG